MEQPRLPRQVEDGLRRDDAAVALDAAQERLVGEDAAGVLRVDDGVEEGGEAPFGELVEEPARLRSTSRACSVVMRAKSGSAGGASPGMKSARVSFASTSERAEVSSARQTCTSLSPSAMQRQGWISRWARKALASAWSTRNEVRPGRGQR